jgi:REP element-mobilizing transposase RayT
MTMARSQLVDVSITRWYHCITRCVRRAFLLSEGPIEDNDTRFNRKEWIALRLQELADIFAVAVGGFSVMDNHLHVLVRLDPDTAKAWSAEEVVRRWGKLFPPRDKSREPLPVTKAWVQWRSQDAQWVATARERLQSLSWFMKCLKEPLARLANRQDSARGAFFEERFKSIAILDEEALLATCTYIDLNPVAAGIAEVPEESAYTSITIRVEHAKDQGRIPDLTAAKSGSVAGSSASAGLEDSIWLCPVEDRRKVDSSREGMLEGFSLGNYLLLVEHTGRLFRDGKAVITAELSGILERIGSSAETWWARMEKLTKGQLFGRFFAATRARLRETAAHLGVHHLANLAGCPAR